MMPDFTVIEGDGEPSNWEHEVAQRHFEDLIVILLRSLASGDGSYQLTAQFFRFLEHVQENKVPIAPIFSGALNKLHALAFAIDGVASYEAERKEVTQAALRVIAESMAGDNAARARLSKREYSLTHAIEENILGAESRSRENGWSYVEHLTKPLGKWPLRKK